MKKAYLCLTILPLLLCCSTTKNRWKQAPPYFDQIQWPEAFNPYKTKFFVHNEIDIHASPEVVWELLITAEQWGDYYEGASKVQVKNGKLAQNAVFSWKTMGLNFESKVRQFEPYSRLSRESKKPSIKGYHVWLILPRAYGCKLVTQESQYGFMTTLEKIFMPNKLKRLHQIWIEEIMQRAEVGQWDFSFH